MISLPPYKQLSPGVQLRMDKIRQRPVALSLKGIGKDYPGPHRTRQVILDSIDLEVHRREFITVIGPSGCGKSTLLRIVAGLETHNRGAILVDGQEVSGPGPDRGMVFQTYSLFPWLTVLGNVAFGIIQKGEGRSLAEAEARTWVSLVGLEGYEDHYPAQLSGGMRQRVAIARALAAKPRLLLMDEPFGALDAQTRSRMQNYLIEIWRNVDITVLFVTHDLDEAVYLSDRILVLHPRPGRIAEFIDNPVPRPREEYQMLSPEFLSVRKRLEDLIHPPVDEREEDRFMMLKLTAAGDEV